MQIELVNREVDIMQEFEILDHTKTNNEVVMNLLSQLCMGTPSILDDCTQGLLKNCEHGNLKKYLCDIIKLIGIAKSYQECLMHFKTLPQNIVDLIGSISESEDDISMDLHCANLRTLKQAVIKALSEGFNHILNKNIEEHKVKIEMGSAQLEVMNGKLTKCKELLSQCEEKDKYRYQVQRNIAEPEIIEIICNNFKLSALQECINTINNDNKEISYGEIRVFATGDIILDCDVKLPGVNLFLMANALKPLKKVIVDTSGRDGVNQWQAKKAKNGSQERITSDKACGKDGEDGLNGQPGESAGHIYIHAKIEDKNLIVFKMNGGRGADGQNGGDGDEGVCGNNGEDGQAENSATIFTCGKSFKEGRSGEKGGVGGNGGLAGLGGQGGNKGVLTTVGYEANNNELCIEANSGKQGDDAECGKGGLGGKDGRDGLDHAMTWCGAFFLFTRRYNEERGKLRIEEIPHWWYGKKYQIHVLKNKEQLENQCKVYSVGKSGDELSEKKQRNQTIIKNMTWNNIQFITNDATNIKKKNLISEIESVQNVIQIEKDKITELVSSVKIMENDINEIQLIVESAISLVESASTSEKLYGKSLLNVNRSKFKEKDDVIDEQKDSYRCSEDLIEIKKASLVALCAEIVSGDIALKLESTLEVIHNYKPKEINKFISLFTNQIKSYEDTAKVNKFSLAYIIGSLAEDTVFLSNIEESRLEKYHKIFSSMPIKFDSETLIEKIFNMHFSILSWKQLEEMYVYISNYCSGGNKTKSEAKIYKLALKIIIDKIHLYSCSYYDHSNLSGFFSGIDSEKSRISIHNLLVKGLCIRDDLKKHGIDMSILDFYKIFLESFKFNLQTMRKELDISFYLSLVGLSTRQIDNQYALNNVNDLLKALESIKDDKSIKLLCVVISYCDLTEEEVSRLKNIAGSHIKNSDIQNIVIKFNKKNNTDQRNDLLNVSTQENNITEKYKQSVISEYLETFSSHCSVSKENNEDLDSVLHELFNLALETDQLLLFNKNMKYIVEKLKVIQANGVGQQSTKYLCKVLNNILSIRNFESTYAIISACQYRNWLSRLVLFEIHRACDDLKISLEETSAKLQNIKHRGPVLELLAAKLSIEQDIINVKYRITPEQFNSLLDILAVCDIGEEKLQLLSRISLHLWNKELKKQKSDDGRSTDREFSPELKSSEWTLNEIIELLSSDNNNSEIAKLLPDAENKAIKIFKKLEKIKHWKKGQLMKWVKALKKNSQWLTEKPEIVIAVLCKVVNLSGMIGDNYPKPTQLLALLLLLSDNKDQQSWFAQVETGEGKTVIVAMLAAIKCYLCGDVDVISSSKVLAVENANQSKEFYRLMGISVSNNCDNNVEKNPSLLKKRYEKNVVYGDIGSFQRDYLNTEYYKKNVMDKRKCGAVIVDEVDSMLLDKSENVLYLSHEIPDLRYLTAVFVKIWYEVCNSVDNDLSEDENRSAIAHEVMTSIHNGIISLPNYIKPLVEKKLKAWIQNAYHACEMQVDHDYMIKDPSDRQPGSRIVIVDKSTGIEQPQMTWSNGLHQFLELKHAEKISNESLKAVFVSNLTYFKHYSGKIYGMSGTLGSDVEKDLLSTLYNVRTFHMPRSKGREYHQEKHIVETSKSKWYEAIIIDVQNKIKEGRAVLVICENIDDVNEIKKLLTSKCALDRPIYTYTNSKDDLKFVSKGDRVCSGDIILATNIAGRGTDLRTASVLEEKGGLSVILSYLPKSIRVQDQAFGRTARNGNKGSGTFIIYNERGITNIEYLIKERNELEMMRIEEIRTRRVQSIEIEDELFKSLMIFYEEIRENLKNNNGLLKKENHINHYISMQLKSLLDEWALWLDEVSENIANVTPSTLHELKDEFAVFKDNVKKTLEKDNMFKLIRAPHEILSLGIYFMQQNEFSLADQCFDEIIKCESEFCGISHYYKALNTYYGSSSGQANSVETRKKIISELKGARNLLRKRLQELEQIKLVFEYTQEAIRKQGKGNEANAFNVSVMNEYQMISVHLSSIDNIIGTDVEKTMFEEIDQDFDKEKFSEFYKKLTNNSDYLKAYRVSKKVQEINEQNEIIVDNGKGAKNAVKIPQQLFYCKDKIIQLLEGKIKSEKRDDKKITIDSLKSIIGSKEEFLCLTDSASIRISCRYQINLGGFSLTKELLSEALHDVENSIDIGAIIKLLKERDGMIFDENFISNPMVRMRLRSFLTLNKLLDIDEDRKITLAFNIKNNIIQIPTKLAQYAEFILWLCKRCGYKNQSGQVEIDISTKDIPLPDDSTMASKKLWDSLIEQRIIKLPKVNYDVIDSDSKHAIQTKLKEIKDNIRKDLAVIYGSEADKCCDLVFDILKKTIGSIKTLPAFKLSLDDLEKYYKSGEFPPEIQDFKNILFGQVMQIEENPSWWNPKAFAIAMIGICTIIAAIVFQVIATRVGLPQMLTTPIFNGLLQEGIGDIIYAIRVCKNQDCTWKDYLINKGISLAGTTIMGGISSFGIYSMQGFQTSEFNALQTVTSVLVEGGKGVLSGISGLLLDHLMSKLPQKLLAGLGTSIKNSLETNNEINLKIQEIRTNMLAIRGICETNKEAEKIINATINRIYALQNNVETQKKNQLLIGACAAEIPGFLVSAAEGLRLRTGVFRWAFLLTIVNYVIKGVIGLVQFSQLFTMSSDYFSLFNAELAEVLKKLKENNENSNEQTQLCINDDVFEKFISRTIAGEKEKQSNVILEKLTKEIIQPKIQRLMDSGINFLSNTIIRQGLKFTRQNAMRNGAYQRIPVQRTPVQRTPGSGVPARRLPPNPAERPSQRIGDLSRGGPRIVQRDQIRQRRQIVNNAGIFYSQNMSNIQSMIALRAAKICIYSSASLFDEMAKHNIEKIKRDKFLSEINTQKILREELIKQQLLNKDIVLDLKINNIDCKIEELEKMIESSEKALVVMREKIKLKFCQQLANVENNIDSMRQLIENNLKCIATLRKQVNSNSTDLLNCLNDALHKYQNVLPPAIKEQLGETVINDSMFIASFEDQLEILQEVLRINQAEKKQFSVSM